MGDKTFNLENRLVDFAVSIVVITESLLMTRAGNHLAGQLVWSGTSPALHYGEAQSAESHNDFIHKLKLILKELRESLVAMKIITKTNLCKKPQILELSAKECNELIAIFVKSIDTARKNNSGKNQ